MWARVKRMALKLFPVFELMRNHRDAIRESEADRHAALEQQHDIARRVHVMEWQTFPRPSPGQHPHRRAGDRA